MDLNLTELSIKIERDLSYLFSFNNKSIICKVLSEYFLKLFEEYDQSERVEELLCMLDAAQGEIQQIKNEIADSDI